MKKSIRLILIALCLVTLSVTWAYAEGETAPAEPFTEPTKAESDLIKAKQGRIEEHSSKVATSKQVSDVVSTTMKPQSYTIDCGDGKTVNVNVSTQYASWSSP